MSIDEIRSALAAGPTPGPWTDSGYRIHGPTLSDDYRDGPVIVDYKQLDGFNGADARYIAACNPTAIRSLLSRLEEAEKDAERYRWLRTAGAWESEVAMDILSNAPEKFDAAVDFNIAAEGKG